MPAKKASIGTLLKRGGTGDKAPPFVTIAGVDNLQGPNLNTDILDVTSLDSVSFTEEVVAGVIRPGEVTADVHFMPDDAQQGRLGLIADQTTRATRAFQILFPSATPVTCTFNAFVIRVQPRANTKNPLDAAITLRVTGLPAWA